MCNSNLTKNAAARSHAELAQNNAGHRRTAAFSIAILGGLPSDYQLLDTHLNKLIEDSGCYLFTILSTVSPFDENANKPLSLMWAEKNGCPIQYIHAEDSDKLIKELFNRASYIIFILHKNDNFTKQLMMKYKMSGGHGSVIYAE